jgi:hypothetical protein
VAGYVRNWENLNAHVSGAAYPLAKAFAQVRCPRQRHSHQMSAVQAALSMPKDASCNNQQIVWLRIWGPLLLFTCTLPAIADVCGPAAGHTAAVVPAALRSVPAQHHLSQVQGLVHNDSSLPAVV